MIQTPFRARCVGRDAEEASKEEIIDVWRESYKARSQQLEEVEEDIQRRASRRSEESEHFSKLHDHWNVIAVKYKLGRHLDAIRSGVCEDILGMTRWSEKTLFEGFEGLGAKTRNQKQVDKVT